MTKKRKFNPDQQVLQDIFYLLDIPRIRWESEIGPVEDFDLIIELYEAKFFKPEQIEWARLLHEKYAGLIKAIKSELRFAQEADIQYKKEKMSQSTQAEYKKRKRSEKATSQGKPLLTGKIVSEEIGIPSDDLVAHVKAKGKTLSLQSAIRLAGERGQSKVASYIAYYEVDQQEMIRNVLDHLGYNMLYLQDHNKFLDRDKKIGNFLADRTRAKDNMFDREIALIAWGLENSVYNMIIEKSHDEDCVTIRNLKKDLTSLEIDINDIFPAQSIEPELVFSQWPIVYLDRALDMIWDYSFLWLVDFIKKGKYQSSPKFNEILFGHDVRQISRRNLKFLIFMIEKDRDVLEKDTGLTIVPKSKQE